MHVPLYQAKADFFRMLGHPVRIRVLELLQHGPVPVRDLRAARRILTELLAGQNQLLSQLQQAETVQTEVPAAGSLLTDRGSPRPTP